MQYRITLFGRPRLMRDGQPADLKLRKAAALFAYVAVTAQPHERDWLATMFWPESNASSARANLRRLLYEIKQVLGKESLCVTANTVALDSHSEFWLDVLEFQDIVQKGSLRSSSLARAADLYQDEFLAGFSLPDSPAFEEWLIFQRETLNQQLSEVLIQLVSEHRQKEEYAQALHCAKRWLTLDPLHEPAHRTLMELYALAGHPLAAQRQYNECVRLLRSELDGTPQSATAQLYADIRTRRFPNNRQNRERLRGVEGRDGTTQSRQETPSRESDVPKNNLPAPSTAFVGRTKEIEEIIRQLHERRCRLLSLVGPGGVGKTTLAQEALRRIAARSSLAAPFEDGIFYIGLEDLNSDREIVSAIADVMDLRLTSDTKPEEQLLNFLHNKRVLLLLDNFEHLLSSGQLLDELLKGTRHVRILVTSREALKLVNEWFYPVHGLSFPKSDAEAINLREHEAIQLFAQRMARVQPDYTLDKDADHIIQICRLVEGNPLAIELASSWLKALQPSIIVNEIERGLDILTSQFRNVPARHGSMRFVLEQTWQMLTAAERTFLIRMTVFRGGFDTNAAGYVAGASLVDLVGLVEKALLRVDSTHETARYHFHELLRQFARSFLQTDSEREEINNAHAAYYCKFLRDRSRPVSLSLTQRVAVEVGREWDNVLKAWQWASAQADVALLLQAVDMFGHYCDSHSLFLESWQAMHDAIERISSVHPSVEREQLLARLNTFQGYNYIRLGRWSEAEEAFCTAKSIYSSHEIELEEGFGVEPNNGLGLLALAKGNFSAAAGFAQVAQSFNESCGFDMELTVSHYILANAYYGLNQLQEAADLARRGFALTEQYQHQWMSANFKMLLGDIAAVENNLKVAEAQYRQAHAYKQATADREGVATTLNRLGKVAFLRGEYQEAYLKHQQSLEIIQYLNDPGGIASTYSEIGRALVALKRLKEAEPYLIQALRIATEIKYTPLCLSVFANLAELFLHYGQTEHVVELLTLALLHPSSNPEVVDSARAVLKTWGYEPAPEVPDLEEIGQRLVLKYKHKHEGWAPPSPARA